MANREQLKSELTALVQQGHEVFQGLAKKNSKIDFRLDYQAWYTKALRVVQSLAPDRYEEFRRYYEPDPKRKGLGYGSYVIQDYIKGVVPNQYHYPDFDSLDETAKCFYNQITILLSLKTRIDSVLANIEAYIQADLQEAELETARSLVKVSPRAAGALAGVILESYLQRVAEIHQVKIAKKNPTIGDLNDPLKQAEIYDTAVWRKISYLADLRNLCSHKKAADPSTEQVIELIEGVNWVAKNVS